MNAAQTHWWRQANSDLMTLELLQTHGGAPCAILHYLQMIGEKIGKAYAWRSGRAPRKTHVGMVAFLRSLGSVRQSERHLVADALGFRRFDDFRFGFA